MWTSRSLVSDHSYSEGQIVGSHQWDVGFANMRTAEPRANDSCSINGHQLRVFWRGGGPAGCA